MKLRPMQVNRSEELLRTLVNLSRFGLHWRMYMHPVVAVDGGWFLPEHGGPDLRAIWLHRGSISSLMPRVVDHDIWQIWHEIEGVVAAIPTAVIHNLRTGMAVMVNLVDDLSSTELMKLSLASSNALIKDLPVLHFLESQISDESDEVMLWLCRAFLDPGQSHLALVRGERKVVVA